MTKITRLALQKVPEGTIVCFLYCITGNGLVYLFCLGGSFTELYCMLTKALAQAVNGVLQSLVFKRVGFPQA